MRTVVVDGDALTVQDVIDVGRGDARAELGPGVPDRMEPSRRVVADAIAGDAPVYGVNTGFGALADTPVGERDLTRLQGAIRLPNAIKPAAASRREKTRSEPDAAFKIGVMARDRVWEGVGAGQLLEGRAGDSLDTRLAGRLPLRRTNDVPRPRDRCYAPAHPPRRHAPLLTRKTESVDFRLPRTSRYGWWSAYKPISSA